MGTDSAGDVEEFKIPGVSAFGKYSSFSNGSRNLIGATLVPIVGTPSHSTVNLVHDHPLNFRCLVLRWIALVWDYVDS